MSLDRRARLEAARDRYLERTCKGPVFCLVAEQKGLALDLSRVGPRALAGITASLGATTVTPIPLVAIGEGTLSEAVGALAQTTRVARIEAGRDDLAVGFPWLEGRTPEGTAIRAPLFLYPATLRVQDEGSFAWVLEVSGTGWLNDSLSAHFRRVTRAKLTFEDFLANDEDGLFKVDDASWGGFTKTLQRAGVTLADTPATLPKEMARFDRYDESAWDAIPPGQYRLRHQMVLGRFGMIDGGVAQDLESALASTMDDFALAAGWGFVDSDPADPGMVGRAPAKKNDDRGAFGALRRWQVLPSDPWQEDALRVLEDIKEGGLCVVGPPGTGKSQLVANLVAASLHKGDRVLVVSPRRGALDDVRQRLADRGIAEPIASLMDPWRDRTTICGAVADTLDPIVNSLDEIPPSQPEANRVTALERELSGRLENADGAYDTLAGGDDGYPGLAEIDEHALIDPLHQYDLPDMIDWVAEATAQDLDGALRDVGQLAPHAAPFIAPHILNLRTDWSHLDDMAVVRVYDAIAKARKAVNLWAATPGPLVAAESEQQQRFWSKVKPIVALAMADDGGLFQVHTEVRQWLEKPGAPSQDDRDYVANLRAEASERTPVPAALIRLPLAELNERIANLDELHKKESSGLRVFTPAYWSLKKLPEKYVQGLDPDVSKDAKPLGDLHREAVAWQSLIETMPDLPAFALAEIGDPQLLMEMIERLENAFEEADAEEAIVRTFGARFPARPDWNTSPPYRRAVSPFLEGIAHELARAPVLQAMYEALEPIRPLIDEAWFEEVRVLARDEPREAEARLAQLAKTAAEGPRVALLDRATSHLPAFVARFLRVWDGPSDIAARACRRAVEEGWRQLRIRAWGSSGVEASLIDPRELRALADNVTQLEDARAALAVARWKERLGKLMEVEATRQDLTKIINDIGRKRLRANLKQVVERHWKRGFAHLRPVWLATPEAVATVFPRDRDTFDLVIIDEANRLTVEAALPALFRGRRVLVLGDQLQAPPFTGQATSEVSTLTVAQGQYPTVNLRWGWGVRREELWVLPNCGWYDNAVQVAPDAERAPTAWCEKLHWQKVDGRYKDGENVLEAEKVVERVDLVLRDQIGRRMPTVGVVACSRAQAQLIRTLIDKRAAKDLDFRALLLADRERPEHEQLVVGDIEEHPCDTRDVLILSLTSAAPEGSKRVHLELTQLLAADGDGLWCGVIARARYGLHIVSSIHDAALDAGRRPELGVKMIAGTMGYALGISLDDDRIIDEAIADMKAATGVVAKAPEAVEGVGDWVRDQLADEFRERGLGISSVPMTGPQPPDLTMAPTPKSAPFVALQTTRFLLEPDTFLRDVWTRRFWQRQGWTLIRVTPGVWRSSPLGVVRAIEKLFSLPARLDQKFAAAAEIRTQVEKLKAEAAEAARREREEAEEAERLAVLEVERAEREAREAEERAREEAEEAERFERERLELEAAAAEAARERAEAEARERADAEARAQADAEARERADAEARERADAEAEDARLRAEVDALVAAAAAADARARDEAEAAAKVKADAEAAEAKAKVHAEAVAKAKAALAVKAPALPPKSIAPPPAKLTGERPALSPLAPPPVAPIATAPKPTGERPALPPIAKPPSRPIAPLARPPVSPVSPVSKVTPLVKPEPAPVAMPAPVLVPDVAPAPDPQPAPTPIDPDDPGNNIPR